MRIVLALLALLIAAPLSAQNLTANRLQLLPAAPGACPVGKVCVVGTTSTAPYRVAFQDASGNTVTMGDAWRLRQCAGPCVGAHNGDMWFDSGTGIAYIKQAGSNLPIGVTSSPVINGTISGVYALGGTPSLAANLNAAGFKITSLGSPTSGGDAANKTYVDGAIAAAAYARSINTSAPLGGGGNLTADRTLSLSTGADLTTSGGALVLAANVRASAMRWAANNGLTFATNTYWGPGSEASSTATNVAPMIAHCSGSVTGLRVQANANATGTTVVTLHRSAGGATLTYAATLLTCTIGSGAKFCSDTLNSYTATVGDVFVIRITSSNWSPAGATATVRIACDAT
jgi:hypothetical protein